MTSSRDGSWSALIPLVSPARTPPWSGRAPLRVRQHLSMGECKLLARLSTNANVDMIGNAWHCSERAVGRKGNLRVGAACLNPGTPILSRLASRQGCYERACGAVLLRPKVALP